jgi:hypothetical protein
MRESIFFTTEGKTKKGDSSNSLDESIYKELYQIGSKVTARQADRTLLNNIKLCHTNLLVFNIISQI